MVANWITERNREVKQNGDTESNMPNDSPEHCLQMIKAIDPHTHVPKN